MAFNPDKYDIELWLKHEDENILQKLCNTYDGNGVINGQYKTRISVVPVGKYYNGRRSITPPCLFRAFNVDAEGTVTTSPPEMREWTQACEDQKIGIIPGSSILPDDGTFNTPTIGDIPSGSDYMLAEYPSGTVETFKYYNGGPTGALLITATVTYTDTTKDNVLSVNWV